MSSRAGFTVVEALIGIVLVGVLTAGAVPLFNMLVRNYRVGASANELYAFLQQARTEAIKRNANVYVSFSTGDNWCVGMNVGSACTCSTSSTCDLQVISANAAEQVSLSSTGYTGSSFYYESRHGMASVAGTFTFTRYDSSEFVRLTAGRMGSVKMCSTGISGFKAC